MVPPAAGNGWPDQHQSPGRPPRLIPVARPWRDLAPPLGRRGELSTPQLGCRPPRRVRGGEKPGAAQWRASGSEPASRRPRARPASRRCCLPPRALPLPPPLGPRWLPGLGTSSHSLPFLEAHRPVTHLAAGQQPGHSPSFPGAHSLSTGPSIGFSLLFLPFIPSFPVGPLGWPSVDSSGASLENPERPAFPVASGGPVGLMGSWEFRLYIQELCEEETHQTHPGASPVSAHPHSPSLPVSCANRNGVMNLAGMGPWGRGLCGSDVFGSLDLGQEMCYLLG